MTLVVIAYEILNETFKFSGYYIFGCICSRRNVNLFNNVFNLFEKRLTKKDLKI